MADIRPPATPACLEMERLGDAWPWKCRQALVVRTGGWKATEGTLRLCSRVNPRSAWYVEPGDMPVMLGKHGLAWGRGIHPLAEEEEPRKREGDGKAPAGIFRIHRAFGYAEPEDVPWIRLPYRRITPETLCIDDPASASYNLIFDSSGAVPDWKSREAMLREDGLYRLGAVIEHNADPVLPGAGSCIFLHRRRGPASPTEGCTALSAEDLERVLRWLESDAQPVLIQLPDEEYEKRRAPWSLP
ncbi:MAG TPA: L,D-transpeptidase family protein [Syntrophales bacterium]|nr:L,D-transpeptidase family protein [Syntrophales bacterium]